MRRSRKRVLVLFPTAWDGRQLEALPREVRARHELVLDEPCDSDVRWDLDLQAYLDERVRRWRGELDGVFSSSDYPGAAAAAVLARALGLRGAPPQSVLCAGHKHASRLAQRRAAPEAVPAFRLFDPGNESSWPATHEYPCFVKPVRGSFSMFARRIDDERALRAFVAQPSLAEYRRYFVRLFEELGRQHGDGREADGFLAEELVGGQQVTVEGWVQGGEAHVLGVVDTAFQPGTRSFARFDYPSALPFPVQQELGRIAGRVARAIGLDDTLFNVEMFHDPEGGRTSVIEVNPRLCGQFGDLYRKVDGTSGFALALDLACGEPVRLARGAGDFPAAASVPLRTFASVRVLAAPEPARVRMVESRHPGTLIWCDVVPGDLLRVGADQEDGASVRYAVINLGGRDREEIQAKSAAIAAELGFVLEPVRDVPGA